MSRNSSSANNDKLYNIEDALHNFNTLEVDDECYELYKANYLFMKQSPMYVRLEQKYKNLKKKLREQSKMIDLLNRQYFETVEKYAARTPSANQDRVVSKVESEDAREITKEDVSAKVIKLEPISVVRKVEQVNIVEDEPVEIIVVDYNVENIEANVIAETENKEIVRTPERRRSEGVRGITGDGLPSKVIEQDVETEEIEQEEVEQAEEETEEVEEQEEETEEVEQEEETEEVEEQEEVEVEETEETEEEEVEVEETEEQEEEGVYETVINGKKYYITNETDGEIYAILEDEDIGDVVGKYVNGVPTFTKK